MKFIVRKYAELLTADSIGDKIYNLIKQQIITGELQPGERLKEDSLSKQLNVSRTPLREALQRLELEGWVVKYSRGILRVSNITLKEAKELYAIREVLEGLLAREATKHITEEKIEELRTTLEKMESAAQIKDSSLVVELGNKFHNILYEASQYQKCFEMLSGVNEHLQRYRYIGVDAIPTRGMQAVEEHRLILAAVLNRDPELAEKATREHIRKGSIAVIEGLSRLIGSSKNKKAGMPDTLTVSSYDVGAIVYMQNAALGEGILETFGVKLRSLPAVTAISRINNVKDGKAQFGAMAESLMAQEGIDDFAQLDYGPLPLRTILISARQTCYSLATYPESGIDVNDLPNSLKGKRVGWLVGSPFTQRAVKAQLAFYGLTLDDVKPVEMFSIPEMYDALLKGDLDVSILDSGGSKAYELESTKGIVWLPFPKDNTEGWERLHAINPQLTYLLGKYGAGLSEDNPQDVATVPHPTYFTYDFVDENTVYWITKMIVESYDAYKDKMDAMAWFKIDEAIHSEAVMPYHDGAIKYYKEIGVWTDKHEENQQNLLERQAELKKLWDQVVTDAMDEGISAMDFPKYWLKRRAEVFPNFYKWIPTRD